MKGGLLFLLQLTTVLVLTGCQHGPLFNDVSRGPEEFHNPTAIVSACEASISRGVDVCRFVEGSKIESGLRIVLPWNQKYAIGGTARVRYKDQVRIYELSGDVFELSYRDLMGEDTWQLHHDGPIQLVVTLRFMNGATEQRLRMFGYVFAVVLRPGYNPYPVLPGREFSKTRCEIAYNELGESRFSCEQHD